MPLAWVALFVERRKMPLSHCVGDGLGSGAITAPGPSCTHVPVLLNKRLACAGIRRASLHKSFKLNFDDWFYAIDDRACIVRGSASRAGIPFATAHVTYRKL